MNYAKILSILDRLTSRVTITHTRQGCKVVTTEHADRDGSIPAVTIELSCAENFIDI